MSKNKNIEPLGAGPLGMYASDAAFHADDPALGRGLKGDMHDGNPAFHDPETLFDESAGTYDHATGRLRGDNYSEGVLAMHALRVRSDDEVLGHSGLLESRNDPANKWMEEHGFEWDPKHKS